MPREKSSLSLSTIIISHHGGEERGKEVRFWSEKRGICEKEWLEGTVASRFPPFGFDEK